MKYKSLHPILFAYLTQGSDEAPPHILEHISDVMFIKTHDQKNYFFHMKKVMNAIPLVLAHNRMQIFYKRIIIPCI